MGRAAAVFKALDLARLDSMWKNKEHLSYGSFWVEAIAGRDLSEMEALSGNAAENTMQDIGTCGLEFLSWG